MSQWGGAGVERGRAGSRRLPTGLGLTRRETEVLEALRERLTNAEIAERLYLSQRTVESHVASLLRKMGVRNRIEAGDLARQLPAESRAPGPELPAAFELHADRASFFGREGELARLLELWHTAAAGRTLVALVTGEAGIGKSRLVAEFAAEVHGGGGRVLLGSCVEDVQRPYEPFVQAMTADIATLTDDELRRRVSNDARVLGRVVPGIAARLDVHDIDDAPDPLLGVGEMFAALHHYLSNAASAHGPLLLVVEDLHWASTTTRGALRYLARVGGPAPLMLVLTTRDAAPDLDAGLAVLLGDLHREASVGPIRLDGLDVDSVRELLHTVGADADPARVIEMTGGNPLFAREFATNPTHGVGQSVRALLARRFALLSDDDLAVVDLAAVLGFEFQADVLTAAARRPLVEVLESLERVEAAGLVAASPGRPGWFSFPHALFRAARYDDIRARRRLELHRQVAAALRARAHDSRVLPELARHACIAAPLGDARTALDYAVQAGDLAERSFAVDEASAQYRRALDVAEMLDPPDAQLRLKVATKLGAALRGAGNPEWRTVLLDAAEVARQRSDAESLAEISWAVARYGGPESPTTVPLFLTLAQEALAGIGPEPTAMRARTLAALSIQVDFTDPAQSFAMVNEARDIARQLEDPVTLGHVLLSYRYYARTPDNAEARHQTSDELVDIGNRTGQSIFTICGLHNKVWSFRDQGDFDAANRVTDLIETRVEEAALPPLYLAGLLLLRASRSALAGDLDGAEESAQRVWAIAGDELDAPTVVTPALIVIRHQQGRLAEFVPMLEVVAQQPNIAAVVEAALALAYTSAGQSDAASAVLDRFVAADFAGFPKNLLWLPTMVMLADAAEGAGHSAAGSRLTDLLEPYSGRVANLPQAVFGPIDMAIAQGALAASDFARAERFAVSAADASRRRKTPILLARELVRVAAACRGRGGSVEETDALIDEAHELAERTGAGLVRQDVARFSFAVS